MKEETIVKKSNKEFLRHPADSVFNGGYGQTPKSIMCDKSISGTARLIYAYLSSYAGGGNVAFPGTGKLCSDLGISRGTFQKHFKQLENAGYMKRYQIKDERNKFSNNIYEFIYDLPKSNNGDES